MIYKYFTPSSSAKQFSHLVDLFFSFLCSYRTMNDCVQRWKHFSNGKAWARITAHKEPMIEPRTAADLKVR